MGNRPTQLALVLVVCGLILSYFFVDGVRDIAPINQGITLIILASVMYFCRYPLFARFLGVALFAMTAYSLLLAGFAVGWSGSYLGFVMPLYFGLLGYLVLTGPGKAPNVSGSSPK